MRDKNGEDLIATSSDHPQQKADDALGVLIQSAVPHSFTSGFGHRVFQSILEEWELSTLIKTRAPNQFAGPLPDRVLATLRRRPGNRASPGSPDVADALSQLFPWITLPAGAVALLAVVLNVAAASPGTPLLDALLGLQSADGLDVGLLLPTIL